MVYDVDNSDVKVCRGCAGTGIGHHVSARLAQLLDHHRAIRLYPPDPEGATPRMRERYLRINVCGPDGHRARGTYHGPLALVIAELESLEYRGFTIDDSWPMHFEKDWCCRWCHGTGQPQLSAHALEQALLNRA